MAAWLHRLAKRRIDPDTLSGLARLQRRHVSCLILQPYQESGGPCSSVHAIEIYLEFVIHMSFMTLAGIITSSTYFRALRVLRV